MVIPAWGERYLRALPDAVASARDSADRVIIVSPQPPEGLPPEVDQVRVDRALSVGAARNLGLAEVESPYVAFLDADDRLAPGGLAAMRRALEEDPRLVAAISQVIDARTGAVVVPRRPVRTLAAAPTMLALANAVWSLLPMQGATLMRVGAAREAGGYADSDGGEDWALATALARAGRIAVLERPGLLYDYSAARSSAVGSGELRRRAAIVRARWGQGASGPQRALVPLIGAAQRLAISVRGLRLRAAAAQRSRQS